MPKIYLNKNVLQSANERFDFIFNNFENIYLSVSGGKDSSVMLQLAAKKAREHNKKIDLLFIDLEAQYRATIMHVEELFNSEKDVINNVFWVCLPISLRNAVSILQPKWTCWEENAKDKWVRNMPTNKWVINSDNCSWDWFKAGMEFEDFIIAFADMYSKEKGSTATGIGIRRNESLNRFTTIISEKKVTFQCKGWTTQVKYRNKYINAYNFFPLYDWSTADIWGAVSTLDLKFNTIYELMYKNGLSIHEQRLCQPYGDDQRNGLDQFKALEYETWERVLNRVSGVNFGNIYARTSLLGNIKSEKPKDMTWQQYTVFLLESIRLYAPELEEHYYSKIKTFMSWWCEKKGVEVMSYKDYIDGDGIEADREQPTWRRIARAIEKNDFWMKRLSFTYTKNDVDKLNNLKLKYANIIGDGKVDKDLERWSVGEL